MYTLQGHSGAANSASFSLDGGFFASAADDAIVMVWRTNFDGLPTNDNHLESGNPVPAIDSAARPTSPPAGGPIGKSPKSRRPSPSRPAPARPIAMVSMRVEPEEPMSAPYQVTILMPRVLLYMSDAYHIPKLHQDIFARVFCQMNSRIKRLRKIPLILTGQHSRRPQLCQSCLWPCCRQSFEQYNQPGDSMPGWL